MGVVGTIFTVEGEFLDEPELVVTVCGTAATASVEPDGSLLVTAPACGAEGFALMEVCTRHGCDTLDEGFDYMNDVPPVTFLRGDCNQDGSNLGSPTDAIFLLTFLFLGGPRPKCLAACDMDGDGAVPGTPTDPVFYLNFNFLGGATMLPPLLECAPLTRAEDIALGCATPDGCAP